MQTRLETSDSTVSPFRNRMMHIHTQQQTNKYRHVVVQSNTHNEYINNMIIYPLLTYVTTTKCDYLILHTHIAH